MPNDDKNGGSGGTDGGAGGSSRSSGSDDARSRRGPTDEGRGVAQRMLRKFRGRAEEALAEMADENKELRVDRRLLREEVDKYKKPGVVVLEGDDAKAYTEFKALGVKPDEMKKKLDGYAALEEKVTKGETLTQASEAAKLLGWNPDATAAAVLDKRLTVSLVDGQKDGKAVKIPHVKPAGADEKTAAVPLADWMNSNAAYLMPALMAKPAANGNGTTTAAGGGSGTTSRATGTQMVEQSGGSGTAHHAESNNGTTSRAAVPGRPGYMTPAQRAASAQKPQ